jgi:hypothetical protein
VDQPPILARYGGPHSAAIDPITGNGVRWSRHGPSRYEQKRPVDPHRGQATRSPPVTRGAPAPPRGDGVSRESRRKTTEAGYNYTVCSSALIVCKVSTIAMVSS